MPCAQGISVSSNHTVYYLFANMERDREVFDLLTELVHIPSASADIRANEKCLDLVRNFFKGMSESRLILARHGPLPPLKSQQP
jgi:hypothetical protein